MHLQHTLTSLLLCTALTQAKPLARLRLHARQFANSSTTVITSSQISTDTTTIPTTSTTTTGTSATCTATTTVTPETNCNQVASAYGLRLTTYEASSPANSSVCQDILAGYGICVETGGASTTPSVDVDATSVLEASNTNVTFGAVSIALNTTTVELSIPATAALETTSSSSLTPLVFAPAALTTSTTPAVTAVETESTVTVLTTTTLTYTVGTARTDVRTLLQVHTVTDIVTFTTTVDLSGPETTVFAANSLISPASATAASSSLCTTPLPPGPVQTGVVPGCTNCCGTLPSG
ncbi:hypothetical protein LTR86_010146 [Recurvomyces mirabilis]|nr:hypothetical protein LTR86_010146 [Recurvomyces mirabilis]